MRIAQEEVFGPVLSVIGFEDEEEAIRIGNDIAYGLAAASGPATSAVRSEVSRALSGDRLGQHLPHLQRHRAVRRA